MKRSSSKALPDGKSQSPRRPSIGLSNSSSRSRFSESIEGTPIIDDQEECKGKGTVLLLPALNVRYSGDLLYHFLKMFVFPLPGNIQFALTSRGLPIRGSFYLGITASLWLPLCKGFHLSIEHVEDLIYISLFQIHFRCIPILGFFISLTAPSWHSGYCLMS